MKKAIYQRYEALAESHGLSNYRVSKETGVSQETLSSWKKGKYTPKMDKIEVLASFFDVDPEFFYDEESADVMETTKDIMKRMPGLGRIFEVSAGNGRINEGVEYQDGQDNEYSTVRICGDSMYPRLVDGDIVKVVPAIETDPSDLTIVKINGDEVTCKYVELKPDGIWLRAENKDVFEDRFYSMQECLTLPIQVVGKAVELVSRAL